MIKAVIFDMDGVLVDSEPASLDQLNDFMRQHGATCSDEFLASLVGSSYTYTCEECLKRMSNDWEYETFVEKYYQYTIDYPINYASVLNAQVKDILIWLREQGYRIAVASSSLFSQIERMMEECQIREYFDEVISGEMFEESKPNPEIYLYTAKALGVLPEECLAIEDSTYGIAAGKKAGMHVLAYRDERFGADQQKADQIIDQMMDIRKILETK